MITTDEIDAYLTALSGTRMEQPFGPQTEVYKVAGKMFALTGRRQGCPSISLKCDPFLGEMLREQHACITPGYHLNKRHWITVELDGSLSGDQVRDLIKHSYDRVVAKLTKAQRASL